MIRHQARGGGRKPAYQRMHRLRQLGEAVTGVIATLLLVLCASIADVRWDDPHRGERDSQQINDNASE